MWKPNVIFGIDRELWGEFGCASLLCLFFLLLGTLYVIPVFAPDVHIAARLFCVVLGLFFLSMGMAAATVPPQLIQKTRQIRWSSPERVQIELRLKEQVPSDEDDDDYSAHYLVVAFFRAGALREYGVQLPNWDHIKLLNTSCSARLYCNREGVPAVVQLPAGRLWLYGEWDLTPID